MDTWGTRGFSAAVITGGRLGLSLGMSPVNPRRRRQAPAAPSTPAAAPVPVAPGGLGLPRRSEPRRRPEEYRAAEQTMISPLLSDPALDRPSDSRGVSASSYGVGYGSSYGSGYEGVSRHGGYRGELGSDGFLAVSPVPAHAAPLDEDSEDNRAPDDGNEYSTALDSLDSSALFGTLSRRYG